MVQLLHKTRAGASLQGKPRVYFACHEQDHALYFEEICDEILKISDCAIFYYAPGEEVVLDEDYYLNLSQMNLVVMPVTTWLLCKPSRAMDVEFSYAIEHHIPVLPLMQERGLEKKYQKKFGDLQFLDKTDTDLTAIPYTEKLKKYLESVLIGDELVQKIRAAFYAYVFLSYRKKDRKYAQKLMRLLHRDPVCRDIAIWYDEFLTPGENFNDSIQEALEKSGLFVLTVTPNLVNETNYIMTTEYPVAQNTGKPILPVEMVATDADAMQNCYPDIPQSIRPEDEQALTAAVLSSLNALALRENDNDPMHNFFIGLAYLGGVDVEINHERAVELITGAAEADLTEAMEKLVSMYESGEGVQRDYRKAALWMQKLSRIARIRYENKPTIENAEFCMKQLWELCKKWSAIHEWPLAEKAGKKMCAIAGRWLLREPSDRTRGWYVAATDKLASIYQSYGGLWEWAVDWRKLGCQQQEILAQDGNLYEVTNLAFSYFRLGDCYGGLVSHYGSKNAQEEMREQKAWYQKSLEAIQRLPESDDTHYLYTLTSIYMRMGRSCWGDEQEQIALEWYEKALSVCVRWEHTDDDYGLYLLATVCDRIAAVHQWKKDMAAAELWSSRAVRIAEKRAENGTIGALQLLLSIHSSLLDIWKKTNNLAMLKQGYQTELELRKKLEACGEKKDEDSRENLLYNMLDICRKEGNLEELKYWLIQMAEFRREEAEEELKTQNIEWILKGLCAHDKWAAACRRVAEVCEEMDDEEGFQTWYRHGIDALKQLPLQGTKIPRWPDYCQWMGWEYRDLQLLEEALAGMEFKASLNPSTLSFPLKVLQVQIQVLNMPEAQTASDDELDLLFTRAWGLHDESLLVCKKILRAKPVE